MSEDPRGMRDAEMPARRRVRADARRNQDAVLEAAKAIFLTAGVDAPARAIATAAGVGVGTLYRRFPTRSDLVAAVFRHEVDACAAEAASLAATNPPGEALAHWLRRYAGFIATKRGLAAALHSGDPAFDGLPVYFRAHFEPALKSLLDAAATAGEVRGDIAPYDLLRAIGNLSSAQGDGADAHAASIVDLLIDGLRFGATAAAKPTAL
ncbi:TetR/AcrR family transcriptional regulator [Siculibacillus lacustris]|uniref:TetR/AcrR family transcriptional regulator n=1 Tax=Siculibacillus lacustris TaxID=1549641 RepID=A0A4Q9VPJ1_9HYPH|nr:TetR/AcrR family transcriptional regulator [Siculibacillus lacustris]TBW37666.1 TetR/AcrR family transcriptional regulator [Siculibacillus lacustris]